MMKNDAVFSNENAKDRKLVEGIQNLGTDEEGDPEISSTSQALQESEQAKEQFEDTDNFYRSALMDCYNG